jgi:Predicted membrane protein
MKKTELIHNNPFSPLLFCDAKVLRYLNILGVALIAVSLLYLMAANWWMLPNQVQLAIPMLVLLCSAIASIYFNQREWIRQSLDTVSGLMLGLSLVVIGQIYQTGADSYQLFLLWAVLLLPWLYRPISGFLPCFVWSVSWHCIFTLSKVSG